MEQHQKVLQLETLDWPKLWPNLKVISCWTHAQAERSYKLLQEKFPGVTIQPKGLLLTEAPITIPWAEAKGNVPLVTETYLEFMDSERALWPLHKLTVNQIYTVISSQFNGYLRYNTQDQVKVTGLYHQVPILEFIGRAGQNCDLAGEKLSENLLQEIYSDVKETFLFIPNQERELPHYIVYVENTKVDWEARLLQIHHYKLARDLGQLQKLEIIKVTNLAGLYLNYYQDQGLGLGDIKEKVLISNLIQAQKFRAWIEKESHSSHPNPVG